MADDRLPVLEEIRERNAKRTYAAPLTHAASADDVPRLLAALDDWADGSYGTGSALDEDRGWIRAGCAGKLREAITRTLTGKADDAAT